MKAASSLVYVLGISVSPNGCPKTRGRVEEASLRQSGKTYSPNCGVTANALTMTESLALLHAHLNEIRDFAGIPKREELLDWNTWKDFLSSMLTRPRKRRNQSTFLFLQSFLCQQEFLGMVQCYPWRQGTLWDEHNSAGFDSH